MLFRSQHRTREAIKEVERFIQLYYSLSTYAARGLTDLAFAVYWGEVKETDLDLFQIGFNICDSELMKSEQRKIDKQNGVMRIRSPFES